MVNSHNEWDKLEEVIVGTVFPPDLPALDLSFKLFFHDNIYEQDKNGKITKERITIKKRYVEEMKEDLEGFVDLLKQLGITVRRPKTPDKVYSINTPYWKTTNFHCLNTRDLVLIVGNEIIETPVDERYRYYETDYMKHLFYHYWRCGAKWTCAPRPLILDHSFDLEYACKNDPTGEVESWYNSQMAKTPHYMNYGYEIMFDAANCMRLGKDIVFNCSRENHRLGAEWLQRHLGNDYKVWPVELTDTHIDSTYVPLRPGLALVNWKNQAKELALPRCLRRKWTFVEAPESDYKEDYDENDLLLASRAIDINVLSIDKNTVICHDRYYKQLQPLLRRYNIECIPCRLRHSRIFSGAFHCITLDVRRDSRLEDYR